MKERILISAAFFYPNIGGYENYIHELYSRLTEKFIIDILILDTNNNPSFEVWEGLNIYRLESWSLIGGLYPIPKINLKNIKILKKILRNNYIFVNTHVRLFTSSFLGLMIAKYKKTKLFNTEHGNGPVNYLKNPIFNLIAIFYDKIIGKLIIKSAYLNIGVSEATCDFLKSRDAKKIRSVYNGVNIQKFKPINTSLKRKLNIPENNMVITFIGRLVYSKGVQDLISCFLMIKKTCPNISLIIVGDGDYKQNLVKLAKNDKNIHFLGFRKDIVEILNITDILVNPSHFEGLPTALLEAGSVGVPIIATDVGGTREIVNENMGYLIDKCDKEAICNAIIEIYQGKTNFDKECIRQYIIKNYSWDQISKEFIDIIRREI